MNKQYLKQIKNFVLILAAVTIIGCSKDGSIGPEGPKGAPGEQGVKGADGSTIHNGNGVPASSIGKVGDFYLDRATTNLYGPKTEGNWGEPLDLKGSKGNAGENGSNGADGSKMLSGKGVPAITLGSSGDFYFDTEEVAFYGPKAVSSWGAPVSLRSPNDDGVKVVTLKNFKSKGTVSRDNYDGFFVENLIIPTVDYHRYYEDGAIFFDIRNPRDQKGLWTKEINQLIEFGDVGWFYCIAKKESVTIEKAGIFFETYLGYTTKDWEQRVQGDDVLPYLKKAQEEFLIDVKIVLIPGTQVNAMKQRGIDVNDKIAVTKYLNL